MLMLTAQRHKQTYIRYSKVIWVIVLVPQEVQKIQMCLDKSISVDHLLFIFNYDIFSYSTTTDELGRHRQYLFSFKNFSLNFADEEWKKNANWTCILSFNIKYRRYQYLDIQMEFFISWYIKSNSMLFILFTLYKLFINFLVRFSDSLQLFALFFTKRQWSSFKIFDIFSTGNFQKCHIPLWNVQIYNNLHL